MADPTIKVRLGDLVNSVDILSRINLIDTDCKTAIAIYENCKQVESEVKKFNDLKNAQILKYSGETGSIKDGDAGYDKVKKFVDELTESAVRVLMNPIGIEKFMHDESIKFKPIEFKILELIGFIKA